MSDGWRRRVVALIAAAGLALVGCGDDLTPRRAEPGEIIETSSFDSPRRVVRVEAEVDPGVVEIAATVGGTGAFEVIAPSDGVVFDVAAGPGDAVVVGQPILSFLPAASRSEELELSILDLRRELAIERDDDADLVEVEREIERLRQTWASRSIVFESPVDGIVGGTREGVELRVSEGRTMFTVSSPRDLVVVALTTPEAVEALAVGDLAAARESGSAARSLGLIVAGFEDAGTLVKTSFRFREPPPPTIEIGTRIRVELDVDDPALEASASWVPAEAVLRANGRSHVLIEYGDGELERLDVDIRRRTDTHVLVDDPLDRLRPGTLLVVS